MILTYQYNLSNTYIVKCERGDPKRYKISTTDDHVWSSPSDNGIFKHVVSAKRHGARHAVTLGTRDQHEWILSPIINSYIKIQSNFQYWKYLRLILTDGGKALSVVCYNFSWVFVILWGSGIKKCKIQRTVRICFSTSYFTLFVSSLRLLKR